VHYERYDAKFKDSHESLTWDEEEDAVEKFKREKIFPNIVKGELESNSMGLWLEKMKNHSYEPSEDANDERVKDEEKDCGDDDGDDEIKDDDDDEVEVKDLGNKVEDASDAEVKDNGYEVKDNGDEVKDNGDEVKDKSDVSEIEAKKVNV
ncbi:Pseudouridine synthase, partial [Danaus plexippus plexippus]